MPVSASRAWSRKTRSIRPSGAAARAGADAAPVDPAHVEPAGGVDRERGPAPGRVLRRRAHRDGRRERGPSVARGHDRDGGALLVLVVALEAHDDAAALAGDD